MADSPSRRPSLDQISSDSANAHTAAVEVPAASERSSSDSVIAVVVTHERRDLLAECLAALGAQTRPPDAVLVVDNASRDGTGELVRSSFPEVEYLRLDENVGGAGGFHAGLTAARERGFEWAWLMDDDTIPAPDALERLLAADGDGRRPLVLASRVLWDDGSDHPMNKPWPKAVAGDETIRAAAAGVMPLRSASFVSIMIRTVALDRYGFPHRHYFIWNDDVEFTARVLRRERGYWVPASVAHHRTKSPYNAQTSAGERFYYEVRNKLWMIRGPAWEPREKLLLLRHLASNIRRYLIGSRFSPAAVRTVARGLRDGLGREG